MCFHKAHYSVSIQSLSHYYRGYGETDKPSKVTDYRMSKLTKDIAELVTIDTFDNTCNGTCTGIG